MINAMNFQAVTNTMDTKEVYIGGKLCGAFSVGQEELATRRGMFMEVARHYHPNIKVELVNLMANDPEGNGGDPIWTFYFLAVDGEMYPQLENGSSVWYINEQLRLELKDGSKIPLEKYGTGNDPAEAIFYFLQHQYHVDEMTKHELRFTTSVDDALELAELILKSQTYQRELVLMVNDEWTIRQTHLLETAEVKVLKAMFSILIEELASRYPWMVRKTTSGLVVASGLVGVDYNWSIVGDRLYTSYNPHGVDPKPYWDEERQETVVWAGDPYLSEYYVWKQFLIKWKEVYDYDDDEY